MRIININGLAKECRIDNHKILDLHGGLAAPALEIIDALRKEKIQELQYDSKNPSDSLCRLKSGFKNMADTKLTKKAQSKIINFAELYTWRKSPHWYANHPGAIGGGSSCADCGYSVICHVGEYCPASHCSSHEKWEKILGTSYKRPEQGGFT